MGSCASVHKGNPSSASAMKFRVSFASKTDKLVMPESPFKDNKTAPNCQPPIKTFDNFGSKEETFFDSRAWLDSDCEDDFFSVNGDFTPSRGNTPVHHSFPVDDPQVNNMLSENVTPSSTSEPTPTGKKKRLSELFRDSMSENQDADDQSTTDNHTANGKMDIKSIMLDLIPKSANGTPYVSGPNSLCSSERTVNGDALFEKEKSMKSVQCCLPSLISCRNFNERKKKMSPAVAVNGKA